MAAGLAAVANHPGLDDEGGGGGGAADGVTIDGDGSAGNPFSSIPSSDTNAGSMSAANFTRSKGLGTFLDWFVTEGNFHKATTGVTEGAPLWPGQLPAGAAAPGTTPDPAKIGGGFAVAAGATKVLSPSIWQSLTGEFWAWSFEATFPVPASGHTEYVGIESLAGPGTHAIVVGSIFASDATHYVLKLFGTSTIAVASTLVVDGLKHRFCVTSDKTTVSLWIDGVLVATATGANFANGVVGGEPNQLMIFNSAAGEAYARKVHYSYQ